MLLRSQPLNEEISKKLESSNKGEIDAMTDDNIKSQHIGKFFDDLIEEKPEKSRVGSKQRLKWIWSDIAGKFIDLIYTVRNYRKWFKTLNILRPWEGFDGLLKVMQTHLNDYIETEEKYRHSEAKYKEQKISAAKETVELLERMGNPNEYTFKRFEEIENKYPKYKQLITNYQYGGLSTSGNFISQGSGWVGKESGKDPREGYFEFIDGRLELAESPDQVGTDKLLAELHKYKEEISAAYEQAEADSDKDFERLGQLLKEHLYTWWD